MADTYLVTPADVAAELPGLYPAGFSATSLPSDAQVESLITTADTMITLVVEDAVGETPSATDRAAPIAKRFVIEWVKATVIRIAYAGRDPLQIAAAANPYADLAKQLRDSIVLLGEQAIGTGETSPRVVTSLGAGTLASRDLLVTDVDIDAGSGLRGRY